MTRLTSAVQPDSDRLPVESTEGFPDRCALRMGDEIVEATKAAVDVQATVTYDDGRYTMVARRTLTTANAKGDPQLTEGLFVPIAFQAWDGPHSSRCHRASAITS